MNPVHVNQSRSIIRRHSRSFALAARLLARNPRRQAESLYAWCRLADDLIDHAPTHDAAMARLTLLNLELDAIYEDLPTNNPAAESFRGIVQECSIPKRYPAELLAGMAMDAAGTRYRTIGELLVYCHRVAGVVGLMMCHVLGVRDSKALPHAAHLGIAMQLTNIARDVAEDWARDRLYLPAEWLQKPMNPGDTLADESFAPAVRNLLTLADRYYVSGDAGLKYLDRRSRFAIRVARSVYAAIGHRVEQSGFRVTSGRAVVSCRKKIGLMLACIPAECREMPCKGPALPASSLGTWEFQPLN